MVLRLFMKNGLALYLGLALQFGIVSDDAFHGFEYPGQRLLKVVSQDQDLVRWRGVRFHGGAR